MPDLLKSALENIGWEIELYTNLVIIAYRGSNKLTWKASEGLTMDGSNEKYATNKINEIVQAYSKTAVTWAAQRAGWQVTNQTENTLNVIRR
jgi:hypothetical protein